MFASNLVPSRRFPGEAAILAKGTVVMPASLWLDLVDRSVDPTGRPALSTIAVTGSTLGANAASGAECSRLATLRRHDHDPVHSGVNRAGVREGPRRLERVGERPPTIPELEAREALVGGDDVVGLGARVGPGHRRPARTVTDAGRNAWVSIVTIAATGLGETVASGPAGPVAVPPGGGDIVTAGAGHDQVALALPQAARVSPSRKSSAIATERRTMGRIGPSVQLARSYSLPGEMSTARFGRSWLVAVQAARRTSPSGHAASGSGV
jgi:hypothetical protein